MSAGVAEYLDHQVREAVDDLWMVDEVVGAPDHAEDLDHPAHAVQAAEGVTHRGEHVQPRQSSRLPSLLDRQIAADRAVFAGRADIQRSHERTFTPEAEPLWFSGEFLAGITHEVLVVHGREDRIIPVEASYHLAHHLPNAQLHVLPHTGHWVQIEQISRFHELARLFLNVESRTKGI